MRTRQIVMTALLALALAATARAQVANDYRFQGKVVDQAGKPLAGVKITLHDPEVGTHIVFETKDDGTFDRQMIPHGTYDATFEKIDYITHTEHLDWTDVERDTIVKIAHIVLESAADQARKDLGKTASKLYEDAYAALMANDCATATNNADQLLTLGVGNYEYAVRFIIARCLAGEGKTDEAVAEYGKVLALKPDLFEAHFDLAGILERQGKHDAALQEFMQAAKLNPGDAETQYSIGAILLQQKQDYEQAKIYLAKAIVLNPVHSQAIKALGFADLWAEKKDVPEGLKMLKKYLELEPNAPDAKQIQDIVKSFESSPKTK